MSEQKYEIPLQIGDNAEFSKTISEADVYLFAGITGDMNRVHLNEQYMATTKLKHRIAHGMLTFSVGVTSETLLLDKYKEKIDNSGLSYLSAGYNRTRFVKPVFFGDTITTKYEIVELYPETLKTIGRLTMVNQHDEVVVVAEHILKFYPKTDE